MNCSKEKVCRRCNYTWNSYREKPVRCPNCGTYHWNEEPTVNTCVSCGHVWFSRTDSVPVRCPMCKTRSWKGGTERGGMSVTGRTRDEDQEDILDRYHSGQGCVRISMDTGLSLDTVIRTVRAEEGDGAHPRMRRRPFGFTPVSGAS